MQDWQSDFCAAVKELNVCPCTALQEGNIFYGNAPATIDYLVLHLVDEKEVIDI